MTWQCPKCMVGYGYSHQPARYRCEVPECSVRFSTAKTVENFQIMRVRVTDAPYIHSPAMEEYRRRYEKDFGQ